MKLFLITFVIISLGILGMGIKILLKKNGEFSGTCASQNPYLTQDGETCSYCGKPTNEGCQNI